MGGERKQLFWPPVQNEDGSHYRPEPGSFTIKLTTLEFEVEYVGGHIQTCEDLVKNEPNLDERIAFMSLIPSKMQLRRTHDPTSPYVAQEKAAYDAYGPIKDRALQLAQQNKITIVYSIGEDGRDLITMPLYFASVDPMGFDYWYHDNKALGFYGHIGGSVQDTVMTHLHLIKDIPLKPDKDALVEGLKNMSTTMNGIYDRVQELMMQHPPLTASEGLDVLHPYLFKGPLGNSKGKN